MTFRIEDLHPDLQPLYMEWLKDCLQSGLRVRGIQGWRSHDQQEQLHSEGVSSLPASKSLHCCMVLGKAASKAFDFGVFGPHGEYVTDGGDDRYFRAGQIAKKLGLVWGGDFVHPRPDPDHIELA